MSQHDFTGLLNQYPRVINQMRSQFTSHEFICALEQQYQHLYDDAVLTYRKNNNPDPERTVHAFLSRKLHGYSALKYMGKVDSRNVRGNLSQCAKWQKL